MNNLKIGMPTLLEIDNLADTVDLCEKLGLNFIELHLNLPGFSPYGIKPEYIKRISQEKHIYFTVHLPEEIDLANFIDPVRNGYIQFVRDTIKWASSAGIKIINTHINQGVYFTLQNEKKLVYELYNEQFMKNLLREFSDIFSLAKNNNVSISIENTSIFSLGFFTKIIEAMSWLDGFNLTWDIGHDAKTDYAVSPLMKRYIKKICHIHLHDCDGEKDHLILFDGKVNVKEMIELAKLENLPVLIEVKSVEALKLSVGRLRERNLIQ